MYTHTTFPAQFEWIRVCLGMHRPQRNSLFFRLGARRAVRRRLQSSERRREQSTEPPAILTRSR